jgi:hypothetical protein
MKDLHQHGHTNDPGMSAIAVWRPMFTFGALLPGFSHCSISRGHRVMLMQDCPLAMDFTEANS